MSLLSEYRYMRGPKGATASRRYAAHWAITRVLTKTRTFPSFGPVHFMGGHHGTLWWDIKVRGGWLVVRAGAFIGRRGVLTLRALEWPSAYFSPNATPWHHAARPVFGRPALDRQRHRECVCDECTASRASSGTTGGNDA